MKAAFAFELELSAARKRHARASTAIDADDGVRRLLLDGIGAMLNDDTKLT